MKFKGFTKKQVAAIKVAIRNIPPKRRKRALLWWEMFQQKGWGVNRASKLKTSPELFISSRLDLQRRNGKLLIVQELLEMRRQALADKVLNYNESHHRNG